MISRLLLLLNTIKYLKNRQIFFRIFYFFRKTIRRILNFQYPYNIQRESVHLNFRCSISYHQWISNNIFTFLNISKNFSNDIDWNYLEYGILWAYNLNYFEYLNQNQIGKEEGVNLIYDFIGNIKRNTIALEPYPTSLRIMNWIKFVSYYNLNDNKINASLYAQVKILLANIEYHILGNHLLENGFAILFGAYFFNDLYLYNKAKKILFKELDEQILNDGGHFELSPMYHQIILYRVLDSINLLQNNHQFQNELMDLLTQKAKKMICWLNAITFCNGDIPHFNDSTYGISPTTKELNNYAFRLNVIQQTEIKNHELSDSGYRKIKKKNYEIVVDIGNIGPNYIPGHAHSDTFTFVLFVKGEPFIVDTGVSTYEANRLRFQQRSTGAHNTVQVMDIEQSQIWSSFRVANRAFVIDKRILNNEISVSHDGYKKIGVIHNRKYFFYANEIVIVDNIISNKNYICKSYLHFYPGRRIESRDGIFNIDNIIINFNNSFSVKEEIYNYCKGFNQLLESSMLSISFYDKLETIIKIPSP